MADLKKADQEIDFGRAHSDETFNI